MNTVDKISDVILMDDYPIVRLGLKELISDWKPCDIICCVNFAETKDAILNSTHPPNLLVVGMHCDQVFAIEQLANIARERWRTHRLPLLVLSEMYERVYAPLCITAGASGFVNMRENPETILSAIKVVMLGGLFVSRPLAQHPIMQLVVGKGDFDVYNLFSSREREIAKLLVENKPLSDISSLLNLSYTTVATYQSRILKKAGVATVSHLAKLALYGQRIGE